MTRKDIWRIRLGLLILLAAVIGVAVWLLVARKNYRPWDDIQVSGMLRVVTALPVEQLGLQQELLTSQKELAMLERFALDNNLELMVSRVKKDRLEHAVRHNWADLAVSEIALGGKAPGLTEVSSGLGTAWLLPRSAINLKKQLEDFSARKVKLFRNDTPTGDLPLISERRILRILTQNAPLLHDSDQGKYRGFEYALAVDFAESLDLKLVVITVPDRDSLTEWLREGRGDLAVAALPFITEIEPPPVFIPKARDILFPIRFEFPLPPKNEEPWDDGIRYSLITGTPKEYAWFFRASNPELKAAADAYLVRHLKSGFYTGVFARYFGSKASLASQYKYEITRGGIRLSPFDHWIKTHAGKHDFDWLLIAALIYQESRFIPEVIAVDGGLGLMQLMPFTAKEMNCLRPLEPEQNIRAGTGYLAKLYDRIGHGVEPRERLCFALAAYNGGYGHLEDARTLAKEQGLNPNRWKDNVEKAYELLTQEKYYSKARYGTCRSEIIIRYVNEITTRHQDFAQLHREALSSR